AHDDPGGCGRRRVRAARPGLARVPGDGARHVAAHARRRGARAPRRRQDLLRRRLPPRLPQSGAGAERLRPGDGAPAPTRRRADPPPPSRQETTEMTGRSDKSAPPALDPEHFRRLAHAAVDLVADYLAGIGAAPVFQPMRPAERATLMQEPLDAAGLAPETALERLRPAVLPHAMGNRHPRLLRFVGSP